ncbi:MAG: monovalent cation/H(+) antiporter subunit G [Xanthomonadales bacterium]|nr:monovalent cation/H(+) antiporter subunit G [Xanthomonadales bacterium]
MMGMVLDIISWVLLSAGGVFVLIGGIGALRMPNLYTRMHAASVTDTMGAILVLTGIMLQAGLSLATIKLGAILIFLLITSPTSSYALASAALLAGVKPDGSLAEDNEATE